MFLSDLQDQRRFQRYLLPTPAIVTVDGRAFRCALMDISIGGAKLHSCMTPPLNKALTVSIPVLGDVPGRVVRHLPHGFAVEFNMENALRSELWAYLSMMNIERIGLHQMNEMLFPSGWRGSGGE